MGKVEDEQSSLGPTGLARRVIDRRDVVEAVKLEGLRRRRPTALGAGAAEVVGEVDRPWELAGVSRATWYRRLREARR